MDDCDDTVNLDAPVERNHSEDTIIHTADESLPEMTIPPARGKTSHWLRRYLRALLRSMTPWPV